MGKESLRTLNSFHQGLAKSLEIPVIEESDCPQIQYYDQRVRTFEADVGEKLLTVDWAKFINDLSEKGGYEATSIVNYFERCVREAKKALKRV